MWLHSRVEFGKTAFNSYGISHKVPYLNSLPNPAAHLPLYPGPYLSFELGKMHPSSIKAKVQSFHVVVYLHYYLDLLFLPFLPLYWIVSISSLTSLSWSPICFQTPLHFSFSQNKKKKFLKATLCPHLLFSPP